MTWLRKHLAASIGGLIVLGVGIAALFAPWLSHSALPGPAGLARLSMANAPPEGAGAPPRMPRAATAEVARTTSSKWRLSMNMCAEVEMSSACDRKDECSPVHIPVGTRAFRGR